jgi:hypothetical protein
MSPEGVDVYLVTLEYKKQDVALDPFNLPRGVAVPEDYYIHPIIRHYRDGQQLGRAYLPDDLDNDWRNDESYLPRLTAELVGLFESEERTNMTGRSFVGELGSESLAPNIGVGGQNS